MAFEKRKLFERARDRWPPVFRVVPTDGVPRFVAEPSLTEVYWAIEEACEPAGEWTDEDEWTGLANWSFHQALCTLARQSVSEGRISREDVTFEMFDEQMRFNLSDDSWAAERVAYEASSIRFH